ncbi:MAG: GxxExxY protein [Muribaculaceae bacterium]|nr:GxxExxY protein [Muribaculaceae bacterium]
MVVDEKYTSEYSFFFDITGEAMRVHSKFKPGLLESAYEAALKYLLELKGYKVERQVMVPIYWDNVLLDQSYRIDLLVNGNIIVELKVTNGTGSIHRSQLFNYMNITHLPFGMILNFGLQSLYYEWYHRNPQTGQITRIKKYNKEI